MPVSTLPPSYILVPDVATPLPFVSVAPPIIKFFA